MRPELRASCGRPHEQPQKLLEGFASDFGGARHLQQLLLELSKLVWEERDSLEVKIVLPAAPVDAVPKLGLAPAHRRVQAREKADQQAGLFHERLFGKHGEQVIHIQPCFVGVASKQGVGNAQQQDSESLPPVGAELGFEVADRVVKELASVLEEQTALLVGPDLHAFVGCLKIQGQSYPLSVCVFRQESAGHIGAGGRRTCSGTKQRGLTLHAVLSRTSLASLPFASTTLSLTHGCAQWPLAHDRHFQADPVQHAVASTTVQLARRRPGRPASLALRGQLDAR